MTRYCRVLLACCIFIAWITSVHAATDHSSEQVIKIENAVLTDLGNPGLQKALNLPSQTQHIPRTFTNFRLQATFTIPDTQVADLWAVYFISLYDGGRVSINGVDIGEVPTSTPETTVRYVRPFKFHISPSLLRNGVNQLELQWSARETLTLVSRIFVGPSESIRPIYEHRLFWQNMMAQAGFVYALAIATILLGIYSLRRYHRSYLLMGLGAIGWAIVCTTYFLPIMPAPLYPYWRFINIIGIVMLTNCSWTFLVREAQPNNRWFPKICLIWAILAPSVYLLNFWINDISFFPAFEATFVTMIGILGLYTICTLTCALRVQWAWRQFIFLLTTVAILFTGLVDLVMLTTGYAIFGTLGYSVQVTSPLWFTALAAVLVVDFVNSIAAQSEQQKLMALKLVEQEAQLTQLHHTNQLREREQATLQERQRIMQDIHDGLGSQLITSLAMSERGALSREQTNLLLRECIDDLRLAIDTMSDTDDQFGMVAGNLRFRMESRLRSAGITLKWDSSGFSDSAVVPASKTLPLLRIMQESITNALKHAQATEIRVVLSSDEQGLHIQISDNGKGFDVAKVRLGKGIGGMEKRARGIGAELSIKSRHCTVVRLVLPLDHPLMHRPHLAPIDVPV
jgi:signal transduction histidine kinase